MQAKQANMLRKVPDVLKDVREIRAIMQAENVETDDLNKAVALYLDNTYLMNADAYGIERWEAIIGLTPKLTDTLDERRFAILARINEQLPFTLRSLEQQLATLCGADGYHIDLDHNAYTLTVRVALSAKSMIDAVRALLNRVVPANMVIDVDLLYNKHSTLSGYTHKELSDYTHGQLRDEVIQNG